MGGSTVFHFHSNTLTYDACTLLNYHRNGLKGIYHPHACCCASIPETGCLTSQVEIPKGFDILFIYSWYK